MNVLAVKRRLACDEAKVRDGSLSRGPSLLRTLTKYFQRAARRISVRNLFAARRVEGAIDAAPKSTNLIIEASASHCGRALSDCDIGARRSAHSSIPPEKSLSY